MFMALLVAYAQESQVPRSLCTASISHSGRNILSGAKCGILSSVTTCAQLIV